MGSGRVASSASAQTCHLCDGKTLLFKSKEDGTRPETTNSAGDNRKNVFEGATFALLGDCRFRKLPLARYFCYRKLLISRGAKLDGGPLAIKNSDKVGFLGHKFCNAKVFSQPKCPFLRQFSFLTAQMSVFTVFCGPHLPLAFQFVCGPGGGGAANKLEGK